ncbi:MAG: lipoyl(octanoyl) transferase LipB [Proteobacteria bacterium]|nr:lipoyl(octanoyl) transferase LipB [Pseudomonadota bacterium]
MIEWKISPSFVAYEQAIETMERRVLDIQKASSPELIWLLEHPPLYTSGTSAQQDELKTPFFPIYKTNRGGKFTYHGPGQRIVYVMIDLKKRKQDVRAYIESLEQWIIDTLAFFNIKGEIRKSRVGIWVQHNQEEKKIAAIGVHLSKWVTYHGIAINLYPDLSHFNGIIPCGLKDYGVTSCHELGYHIHKEDFDNILKQSFFNNTFLVKNIK